ncbi:hypothetical protein CI610_01871 [invertebrate metagenome]|uniref:DUF218 domain-containing protein n=1 Tax=invertebrate metagenome TaxID=1711999 RepID=A0A2H9T7H9_9ZZZZ
MLFSPKLIIVGFALLYILSTANGARLLIQPLEMFYSPINLNNQPEASAIVILGGGAPKYAQERQKLQPSLLTLERLQYGAWLYKQTGIPILTSGGGRHPESESMAITLESDFSVPVQWQEKQSLTTWQNALFTRESLSNIAHQPILLVTHAWHMPRSVYSFKKAGFNVIPAPLSYFKTAKPWYRLLNWIPTARSLQASAQALREYGGLIWYRITCQLPD